MQSSNSTISITRTLLSNGLQSVITSTDTATVTQIQTQATNSKMGFGIGLGYFIDQVKEDTHSGSIMRPNTMNRGIINTPAKSPLLPASIYTAIDTKLASLSTNDLKLTWLNGVNQKIDVLATKVTSQKSKDILNALKDLLNQKIDIINNVGVDASILNQILQ